MPLRISYSEIPTLIITRHRVDATQLCYVGRVNKTVRYPLGKSAIVYIGTTRNGLFRIANSAAWKAESLLGHYGITTVSYSVIECGKRRNTLTWRLLERALIIRFRERFGSVPLGNDQFKNANRGKEFDHFSQARLDAAIDSLSDGVILDWE